jgi:hypothetical protein
MRLVIIGLLILFPMGNIFAGDKTDKSDETNPKPPEKEKSDKPVATPQPFAERGPTAFTIDKDGRVKWVRGRNPEAGIEDLVKALNQIKFFAEQTANKLAECEKGKK